MRKEGRKEEAHNRKRGQDEHTRAPPGKISEERED
jgi:hypothetical protein